MTLGLKGDFQTWNASLAVRLCQRWLEVHQKAVSVDAFKQVQLFFLMPRQDAFFCLTCGTLGYSRALQSVGGLVGLRPWMLETIRDTTLMVHPCGSSSLGPYSATQTSSFGFSFWLRSAYRSEHALLLELVRAIYSNSTSAQTTRSGGRKPATSPPSTITTKWPSFL